MRYLKPDKPKIDIQLRWHCVKSVRIWSYSGPHFCHILLYSVRMRENTEKMRTTITPNTETFYVLWVSLFSNSSRISTTASRLSYERKLGY